MKGRRWLPLIGLALSVFVFNMSEFIPIGLLTDIAADFSVTESKAGLIISVYAWAVAILSLPLMLLLRTMEYRRMLLMTVSLFALFQFASAASGSYWMLMASRVGVAVAHSVFWSIATPMAVRVVEAGYERVALSAIAAGTSVAMIAGIPFGRVVGTALGWRMAFVAIAFISAITLIVLALVFPRIENPGTFAAKDLPSLLGNRIVTGIYVVVAVYVTGYFTMYSYIEPFLGQIAGMSDTAITLMLTAMGSAGIVGSVMFSKIYDRARSAFLLLSVSVTSFMMLALSASAMWLAALVAVCGTMGACHTAFVIAVQNELMGAVPMNATPIAMSMFSGIFNVGIAMGSIIGGLVTDIVSVADTGKVGFALSIAVSVFVAVYLIPRIEGFGTDV